ncbi:hypothetical protein [Desulfosoma sp.]
MKKIHVVLALCTIIAIGCADKQRIKQTYIQNMAARIDMGSVGDYEKF